MPNSNTQMPLKKNRLKKVRYEYISKYVYTILHEYNIFKYPISIMELIDNLNKNGYNIQVDTYEQFMQFKNFCREKKGQCPLTYYEIGKMFKSNDGATAKFPKSDLLIIFYNSREPIKGRINWTLAHELGHILLGHYQIMEPVIIQRRDIPNEPYKILEKEANWFARTLLCHPYILAYYKIDTSGEIVELCNVSTQAASYREDDIKNHHYIINKPWDDRILKQLSHFYKFCVRCDKSLIPPYAFYCPVCGNQLLKWGDGKMQYKIRYDLNEESRLYQCSVCENENIPEDAIYCQICGTPVQNKCTNCGKLANSDARYCIYCGNKTTFNSKILPDWESELEELKKENHVGNVFRNIPDEYPEDDDGLPFS